MADVEEEVSVASDDSTGMEDLATLLDVSLDALQELADSEEYRVVLEKVVEHLNSKNLELEEYSSTMRQFSENLDMMDVQTKEKDNQIEELTNNIAEESALRDELQRTISSYALAEVEWKQKMEENEQEMEEMQEALEGRESELEQQTQLRESAQNELQESRREVIELEDSLQSKLKDLEETDEVTEQLKQELEQTKQQLEAAMAELADTQSCLLETQERVADLSVPPTEIPGADRQELLRMLDRRQLEISRLADEWKNMSSQLEVTSAKKTEFQNRLDELVVQEASLRLKEQLLQQEKHLIKSQNEWLSTELQSKSEQLLSLRKEKASAVTDLDTKLTQKEEEVKHLSSILEDRRKSYTELEEMAEGYLKRMKEDKEEMSTLEEHLRKELTQQTKLTELYRSSSEDSERRVSALLSGVEKLQTLVEEVSQEKEQLQAQLEAEAARYETVEKDLSTSLASQKQELTHANDLLTSLRQRGSVGLSNLEVLSLSPAAAKASALLKSGKSLTQIYSEHIEVGEELEKVKQDNQSLNNYIEQIVQELAEKTPALQKLRRDYDASVQNCNSLSLKLNTLFEECETLRLESEDSVKLYRGSQRENQRLKALTSDLGRQVKILLKEVEEVRGGVASTSSMSHDYSMDVSSGDISSSSQAISQRLVEFRGIEELQEQNQRLLLVVRELGEQNEERERLTVDERTLELKNQLDTALEEVKELQESRERQTEMVKSIVQQRDMYRTLLAQATPLPPESGRSGFYGDESLMRDSVRVAEDGELAKELKELKEQFEAYRKEKVTNDQMLLSQVEETRDQCSTLRLDNAKLSSKLEHANDRYQLLGTQTSSLKKELDMLRSKNQQLSNALSSHQATISTTTQVLMSTRERISKAEVDFQTLKTERDMLEAGERRARSQYEDLLRQQKGRNLLLTNLRSIQNNLEKSEFETKIRMGAKVDGLERELALFRDKLHSEEDRRVKMADAYDTQVKELESKLSSLKEIKSTVDEKLKLSEEETLSLKSDLEKIRSELEERQRELQEKTDKVLRLEDDAGSEFRGKIRLLERQLADSKVKVQSLEGQLESSKKHEEQYKSMSLAYEEQLQELNTTTEEFKTKMELAQTASQLREQELTERVERLEVEKKEIEEELQTFTGEKLSQISELESQVSSLMADKSALQLEVFSTNDELDEARIDVKRYADTASETQDLYQHELTQHGKSVETLLAMKDQLKSAQEDLSQLKIESLQLSKELATAQKSWEDKEKYLTEQCASLEARAEDLTQQNTLLHQEAAKLSARVLTLQEQQSQTLDTSGGGLDTSGTLTASNLTSLEDKSTEQLWEIIRYVRREKEIATTKQEMADSENTRQKQLVEHLQRQLSDAQTQLRDLTEAAQLHSESAAQHDEILAKVETLNVLSDSNKLLREERDRLTGSITDMETKCEKLEADMVPLRENNKLLTAHKDALVAEKTALRNEVQRWNTRTNQLIEQYNKIDPDEYKKLLEERDTTSTQLTALKEDVDSLQSQLTSSQTERDSLTSECTSLKEQIAQTTQEKESLAEEMKQLQSDVTSKQDDIQAKTVLVGKLRDVGRKFRHLHEGSKKEVEELKTEVTDLKKKLEEAQTVSAETSAAPLTSEHSDKTKELEDAQSTIESQRISLQQTEDKYNKLVKTVKAARNRIQALTNDKDKATKELESANTERDKLKSDLEALQQELTSLKGKHETETTKFNGTINKLQQALKERGPRRKVVPPSISEGSPSLLSTAPTAAVKPTVTTTPTASIRPMAIQTTTSAPTAHVTPTMVAPVVSTQLANQISLSSTSTTPAAAVFLRSSSTSQIVTRLPPTTSMVSSSVSTPSTTAVGIARASSQRGVAVGGAPGSENRTAAKRQREDDAEMALREHQAKRKKTLHLQRLKERAVEEVASSSLAPDTQGETMVTGVEGQASESQVLAAESQSLEQIQPEESEETVPQIIPETDLDTQPTQPVSISTEAMQVGISPLESEERPEDIVSPPASVELPTQMTQVTQSEEVTKSDSTGSVSPPTKTSLVTSQQASVTAVESTEEEEIRTSEAVTMPEAMSSEAEMVRIGSMDSREVSTEPSLHEVEPRMTGEVSGTDSQQPPVDSSELSLMIAGGSSEVDEESTMDTERVSESRDEVEGDEDVATLGQADTTQRMEEEGIRRGTSEPLSETVADEVDDRPVEVECESGEGVEGEVGEGVEDEVGEGVEDEVGEGVDGQVGEGVEREMSEGVEGEGGESVEGEDVEDEETEENESSEEEQEDYEEDEDSEEEEQDDTGDNESSTIIIIDSDTGASSGGEKEEEDEFEIRVDTSDEEEVDSSDSEDDNLPDQKGDASPQDDESHDQDDGSHDQGSESHDQPVEPYVPGGSSTSGYEYEPSDVGLPEDEPSVNIVNVQPPRPTYIPTVRRVMSQSLQFSGERPSTAVTPGFEPHTEDSVVPHTPVLNEGKQLGMANRGQTIPSTPLERPSHTVPQIVGSSLTTESMQVSGAMQSLGESHIDIGPAVVPPPTIEVSHDSNVAAQLVGSDGDINDIVIDDIVGEETSGSEDDDTEEGQLDDDDIDQEEQMEPSSAMITTTTSESHLTLPPTLATTSTASVTAVPSISEQVSSVAMAGEEGGEEGDPPPAKRKPQPIVWSQPSSSSGAGPSASGGAAPVRGSAKRKIIRRVGPGSQVQPSTSQTGRRGGSRFKTKPQK